MKDDTRKELERIEKELLADDTQAGVFPEELLPQEEDISMDETVVVKLPEEPDENASLEDILDDTLIREVLSEPAFEDPDAIHDPAEPLVYCNYSNDYGRDLPDNSEYGEAPKKEITGDDKLTIGLMITASGLCLGIVAVLIYWLIAYL